MHKVESSMAIQCVANGAAMKATDEHMKKLEGLNADLAAADKWVTAAKQHTTPTRPRERPMDPQIAQHMEHLGQSVVAHPDIQPDPLPNSTGQP